MRAILLLLQFTILAVVSAASPFSPGLCHDPRYLGPPLRATVVAEVYGEQIVAADYTQLIRPKDRIPAATYIWWEILHAFSKNHSLCPSAEELDAFVGTYDREAKGWAQHALTVWNCYHTLFARYGGRVIEHVSETRIFDWEGIHWQVCPVDALVALLHEMEAEGDLVFHDSRWRSALAQIGFDRVPYTVLYPDTNPFELAPPHWSQEAPEASDKGENSDEHLGEL